MPDFLSWGHSFESGWSLTSDHVVAGLNPTGREILSEPGGESYRRRDSL